MIDYSKLSDFEINAAVECERDESYRFMEFDEEACEFIYCDPTGENCQRIKPRDYCNDPSDAWPIIFDNNIFITFRKNKTSLIGVYNDCPNECEAGKELREAMIVYLMMQEGE